jgi:hypothetical protein
MTTPRAEELRARLIRNHETAAMTRFERGTRYESVGVSFTEGLAARDLGVDGDISVTPAGPEYPHHIVNTSDAPLEVLSISTRRKREVCEYPDSGKVNAFSSGRLLIHRKAESLDYWDGEPGA